MDEASADLGAVLSGLPELLNFDERERYVEVDRQLDFVDLTHGSDD